MIKVPSKKLFFFSLALGALLLSGCSNLKAYPQQENQNITISSATDSGSFFSSVHTEVDIYTLDEKCNRQYEGTLYPTAQTLVSGIDIGKRTLISFVFAKSSFFGNSSSSTNYPLYLKARKGYTYEFIASYKDSIYNVELFEINKSNKKRRAIAGDTVCKAAL